MNYRQFGTTDMKVSELGYGTSEIGFRDVDPETISSVLNSALDAGLNIIDTAECYRDSEEKIGVAVGHRRAEYFLFTKCGHASGLDGADWDPAMIAKQIDRSLTRLKTDYVDLLQLHTCSLELLQQGEVIEVIERAKQAGKTRYIGYSGDNEAAKWAVESGRFDALQMSLNVMDQANIDSVLPSVLEKKVGLIIKRPIANAAWLNEPAEGMYARAYWDRWITLKHPELDTHPDEAVARALHFTLSQPGVCTAIVGSSTRNRFQHNLDLLTRFPHDPAVTESIRARFKAEAPADWIGLT